MLVIPVKVQVVLGFQERVMGHCELHAQCLFWRSDMAPLLQAEELVPRAEQSLKDFETTMGLMRVRAPGRGVPSTTAGAGKAAAAKAAPTRKPASASAAAGASASL